MIGVSLAFSREMETVIDLLVGGGFGSGVMSVGPPSRLCDG